MPILIQKYIFTLVPQQSPFFIRPIASLIFGQLEKLLSAPEIKKNLAMVRSTYSGDPCMAAEAPLPSF